MSFNYDSRTLMDLQTSLKPLSMINSYPPAIQEKVLELGLITKEEKSKSIKSILKKIIALFLLIFIISFVKEKSGK